MLRVSGKVQVPAAGRRRHHCQRLGQQPRTGRTSERGISIDLVHVDVDNDHPRGRAGRNGKVRAWLPSPPRLHLPGISGRLVETTLRNRAFPVWRAREDRHIEPGQLARNERQRYALAEPGEHRSDRRSPARDHVLRRASVAYLSHRQTSFRRRPPRSGATVRP